MSTNSRGKVLGGEPDGPQCRGERTARKGETDAEDFHPGAIRLRARSARPNTATPVVNPVLGDLGEGDAQQLGAFGRHAKELLPRPTRWPIRNAGATVLEKLPTCST